MWEQSRSFGNKIRTRQIHETMRLLVNFLSHVGKLGTENESIRYAEERVF